MDSRGRALTTSYRDGQLAYGLVTGKQPTRTENALTAGSLEPSSGRKYSRLGIALKFAEVLVFQPERYQRQLCPRLNMAEPSNKNTQTAFTVPPGATVNVSIIDTTTKLTNIPWSFLMKPAIKGHDRSKDLPALSFLIEHSSGRRVLFDLGTRKDFMQIDAPISARVKDLGWQPSAEKNVIEILEENNIPGRSIEALIWRYLQSSIRIMGTSLTGSKSLALGSCW